MYTRRPIGNLVVVGLRSSPTGPRLNPTPLKLLQTLDLTLGLPQGPPHLWHAALGVHHLGGNPSSNGSWIRVGIRVQLGPNLGETL